MAACSPACVVPPWVTVDQDDFVLVGCGWIPVSNWRLPSQRVAVAGDRGWYLEQGAGDDLPYRAELRSGLAAARSLG